MLNQMKLYVSYYIVNKKIRLSFLLRISIKNWKVLIKYIAFQKEF